MRGRGYLFLLSHMRGQTTLLTWLLASHPEIDGHIEQHHAYATRSDLAAMRSRIERELGAPARGRLLLDKVLHNRPPIAPAILARPDVRVIVMVRRPAATIASLVRHARARPNLAHYTDPARAADYYTRRVAGLRELAAAADGRWRFVLAEDLVRDAGGVLAGIAGWLELGEPIATSYRAFDSKPGLGDTSAHIRAGRVLNDDERPPADDAPVDIPADRLAVAVGAWQDVVLAFTGTRPPAEAAS